jgi:hypothetical protein
VTTGLVVDVTPAEQDQVEPVSKEDEDELNDAENNIVTGEAAMTVIFPTGFKTTRLFPMGFLKDFVSWVRKLLPTLALHVITLVFMCLIWLMHAFTNILKKSKTIHKTIHAYQVYVCSYAWD